MRLALLYGRVLGLGKDASLGRKDHRFEEGPDVVEDTGHVG